MHVNARTSLQWCALSLFLPVLARGIDPEINEDSEFKPRIIGGYEAEVDRFEYVVSVEASLKVDSLVCGGSLIAPNMILCAAHCAGENARFVQVSKHYRKKADNKKFEKEFEMYRIKEQFVHPDYDPDRLLNDIAIFVFEGDSFRPTVNLDMPNGGVHLKEKDEVTVVGWGRETAEGSLSSALKEAQVKYRHSNICKKIYGDAKHGGFFDPKTQLCVLSDGTDTCQGDSGGPLIFRGQNIRRDVQIGIISWGVECGSLHYPAVYTKVSAYSDWIEAVCRDSDYGCAGSLSGQGESGESIENQINLSSFHENIEDPDDMNVHQETTANRVPAISGRVDAPKDPLLDVALGAAVTASSSLSNDNMAKYAFDGSSSTEWASSTNDVGADAWIEITLLKPLVLTHIGVWSRSHPSPRAVQRFTLTFSDGSVQTCEMKAGGNDDQLQYFDIEDVETRIIRIVVEEGGPNAGARQISAFVPMPPTIRGEARKPNVLGPNVAVQSLGANATASSFFGSSRSYKPQNAIDERDKTSEWASWSEGSGAWLKLDLGSLNRITHFMYQSRSGNKDWVRSFIVFFSDGSMKRGVMDTTAMNYMQYFDIGNVETDCIWFKVDDGGANAGAKSIGAYISPPPRIFGKTRVPKMLGKNVALGAKVTASSYFHNVDRLKPENAVDGDRTTQWASWNDSAETWLEIKLERESLVSHVGYRTRPGIDFCHSFLLRFSDGSIQMCHVNARSHNEYQYFDIYNVVTDSVRFKVMNGGPNAGAYEISVYAR